MRLIDIEQPIFVPVVDETHDWVTVEMGMTVGEFFSRFCPGFKPEVVEAIPVEWIMKWSNKRYRETQRDVSIVDVLEAWQKEQEAQDV